MSPWPASSGASRLCDLRLSHALSEHPDSMVKQAYDSPPHQARRKEGLWYKNWGVKWVSCLLCCSRGLALMVLGPLSLAFSGSLERLRVDLWGCHCCGQCAHKHGGDQ